MDLTNLKSYNYGEEMGNRTLCDVLNEMRKANSTRNYSYLEGLIEEAQMMGNRMEASLYDKHDLRRAREELKAVRKKIKKLREEAEDDSEVSEM